MASGYQDWATQHDSNPIISSIMLADLTIYVVEQLETKSIPCIRGPPFK